MEKSNTHYFHLHRHWVAFILLFFSMIISLTSSAATLSYWQRPYFGAYLGHGFGSSHNTTNTGTVTDTSYFPTILDSHAINQAGAFSDNPNATTVGIEAGHDWIWKQWVYGVVFDYGSFTFGSSKAVNNVMYPDNTDTYSVSTSVSTHGLFTLRGRLGWSLDLKIPALFYLTGGAAMTQLKVSNQFSDNSALAGMAASTAYQNKLGWISGAGIEIAAFKNISFALEYLYLHVPSVKTSTTISNTTDGFGIPPDSLTSPFSTTGQFHASLVKLELNYRFDE